METLRKLTRVKTFCYCRGINEVASTQATRYVLINFTDFHNRLYTLNKMCAVATTIKCTLNIPACFISLHYKSPIYEADWETNH